MLFDKNGIAVETNKPRLWKLALGDIIFKTNEDIVCSFGSIFKNDHIKNEMLAKWWHIRDRHSFLRKLSWLEHAGHSALYDKEVQQTTSAFSTAFIEKNHARLQHISLRAWDLGRLATLARLGFLVGYLPERQFWEWMDRIGPKVQQRYRDWNDYAQHYMLGRLFWSKKQAGGTVKHAMHFLTSNAFSPWKSIPWDTDLSQKAILPLHQDNPHYFDAALEGAARFKAIKAYFEQMLRHDRNPNLLNTIGVFYSRDVGNRATANDFFSRAIQAGAAVDHPFVNLINNLDAERCSTSAHHRRHELELEIVATYKTWLLRMPKSDKANYAFADWMLTNGFNAFDAMESMFLRAIELNDGNPDYYNSYGCFLNDIREDYENALTYFKLALLTDPYHALAADNIRIAQNNIDKYVTTYA